MKRTHWLLLLFAVVFVASIILSQIAEKGSSLRELSLLPAVAALFYAIYELLNDKLKFERTLIAQERLNNFSVGASSHIANVAFDKHVEFSEEYAAESHETLRTLFREGPTPQALNHANQLAKIREKYVVWLTTEIDTKLEKIESALRGLGALAQYRTHTEQNVDLQKDSIARLYVVFANLVGPDLMGSDNWQGETLEKEKAIQMVFKRLRLVLGVEELTRMREAIIARAAKEP